MSSFDFKCDKCGFTKEYNTSKSLPKEFNPPEDLLCPECHEGKLEKDFVSSVCGISFDVINGYDYEYGKKAWKRNMNINDQAKVLEGKKDPY
jgi:hypothetical protein